jgi:hypothetical protein
MNAMVTLEALERLSQRIVLVEQALLERILRLEARLDVLKAPAGDLSIKRCQQQIDEIMRRPDDCQEVRRDEALKIEAEKKQATP